MTSSSSTYLTQLHKRLNTHFNLAEIQDLCLRLNVDYESVSGDEKPSRIRGLLLALGRNGRLPELITIAQQLRPNSDWPPVPNDFQLPESLTLVQSVPTNQTHIYGDIVYGDKIGGDKVMGDKYEYHLPKKAYDLNSPQNKLNRKNIIANVRSGHIEGVLNQALHKKVRIELNLEYDPTALVREMELWEGQQIQRTISQQDDISDVFDNAGQALLILGAPGSGKTIALLELCKDLLKHAEEKKEEPLPVVLNLSTWAGKKDALDRWIVRELHRLYTLNEKVGQAWLDESQMCLLLDGLDEVAEDVRDECVQKINEFRETYTAPMVVCSRIKDYEELSNKLHLQTAVIIQPLSDEQVKEYLTDKRLKLDAVYKAVKNDDALNELSRVPLNLNVMALAYGGNDEAQLKPLMKDVENRRQHLYDAYIVRMFQRRPLGDVKYDEPKALSWSQYLAAKLTQREETQFFIEDLQPGWLPYKAQHRQKRLNSLVVGLVVCLGVGIIFGLFFGLVVGLIFGPSFGLFFGLGIREEKYQVTDKVIWVGFDRWYLGFSLAVGLVFSLAVGLVFGLVFSLALSLFTSLIVGLRLEQSDNRLRLNQGIKSATKNGLAVGLGIGLAFGLLFGLLFGSSFGLFSGLFAGLFSGLSSGLFSGLIVGLTIAIQHYLLRWTLYRQNLLPLHLVPFLNDMADHLLLQNAGAYFRFFHRSMQEHFATLTPKDIDRLVAEIKNPSPPQ